MPMRSEMVRPSSHGHHRPYGIADAIGSAENTSCEERIPPVRLESSRSAEGAVGSVLSVHTCRSAWVTIPRAWPETSMSNVDATQLKRLSQLHPRLGHPTRSWVSASKTA